MAGYGGYYAYNKYYANNKKEQSVSDDGSSSQLDQKTDSKVADSAENPESEEQEEKQNEVKTDTVLNPEQPSDDSEKLPK